jgi:hypothetical protein
MATSVTVTVTVAVTASVPAADELSSDADKIRMISSV